jgi:hypothetical protein
MAFAVASRTGATLAESRSESMFTSQAKSPSFSCELEPLVVAEDSPACASAT